MVTKKQLIEQKLDKVDKSSGTYVVHQIDHCRGQIAYLTEALATKKDYSKRLAAKLKAYQEIAELLTRVGGSEEKIEQLLKAQEKETESIEESLRNDQSARVQANMFAFDDFDDY